MLECPKVTNGHLALPSAVNAGLCPPGAARGLPRSPQDTGLEAAPQPLPPGKLSLGGWSLTLLPCFVHV